MKLLFKGIFGLLGLLTVSQVQAATIKSYLFADLFPTISITGVMVPGDAQKFIALAEHEQDVRIGPGFHIKPILLLDSLGGDATTAIEIGTYIQEHPRNTVVPAGKICFSACGLVWLAGETRVLDPGAHVGFHSAYDLVDNQMVTSPGGNAMVGAYLKTLGLSYPTIYYLTNTPPRQMLILQEGDDKKYGIKFKISHEPMAAQLPGAPMQIAPPAQQQPLPDTPAQREYDCKFLSYCR